MSTRVIDKVSVFKEELKLIKNERYLRSVKYLINLLPDYFFVVPASSGGKYHPDFARGEGGLVRHTKVAIKIASVLLVNDTISSKFTSDEKELIIIAILLHDGIKKGFEEDVYTKFNHPELSSEFVISNKDSLEFTNKELTNLTNMIKRHMGQWNICGNIVLEKPETKFDRFVHMCDYLSSKKFLNVNFDEDNNIIE